MKNDTNDQSITRTLLELARLLRRTRTGAGEALSLLVETLQQVEHLDRRADELEHADYPRHEYGYGP